MRARSRKGVVLAGLALVSLLSGCTTTTAGNATSEGDAATSESPPGTSGELPTDGAPAVANPIDTSRFERDSCLVLTSGQVGELGLVAPGEAVESAFGSECLWKNDSVGARARILILSEDRRGLSAVYAAEERGEWDYFDELPPIDGYPAVARGLSDDRAEGVCSVVVGASDEIAFVVAVTLSEGNRGKKDPCDVGVIVAGMALGTMKAG